MSSPKASYARTLFTIAALFNFGVAFALLFLRPWLGPLFQLDAVAGTNLAMVNVAAALIATMGYAYARVAADPARYRVYVELGIVGKLLAVLAVAWPWLHGEMGWQLPLLVTGDLVFAGLFIDYLRRSR